MIRYLDASAFVPVFVNEAASGSVRSWLRSVDQQELALSRWTITEVVSAIGIRVRTGTITDDDARHAVAACLAMVERGLPILPVRDRDYTRATDLMLDFSLGLRAGDALHIAVAMGAGAACLVTLDRRMAQAAERLGLPCELPA